MIPAGHRSEVFLDFTLTLYFHTERLLKNSIAVSALYRQRVICVPSALWAAHEPFQSRNLHYSSMRCPSPVTQCHTIILPSSRLHPHGAQTSAWYLTAPCGPGLGQQQGSLGLHREQPLTVITAISHPTWAQHVGMLLQGRMNWWALQHFKIFEEVYSFFISVVDWAIYFYSKVRWVFWYCVSLKP